MAIMADAIKNARELCGCSQCQGGYDIGQRTIAANVRSQLRPYSCVAAVVLDHLLDDMRASANVKK